MSSDLNSYQDTQVIIPATIQLGGGRYDQCRRLNNFMYYLINTDHAG